MCRLTSLGMNKEKKTPNNLVRDIIGVRRVPCKNVVVKDGIRTHAGKAHENALCCAEKLKLESHAKLGVTRVRVAVEGVLTTS